MTPARLLAFALALAAAGGLTAQPPAAPPSLPKLDPEKLADKEEAAKAADAIEKEYAGKPQPEAVRMLVAILRGSQMGPQDGWFGPAQSRYTWAWLTEKLGAERGDGGIPKDKFPGPAALFDRLDRDGDGRITAGDLDWSDRNPYVQQMNFVNRVFRRMDAGGDGKLTKEDFDEFLKRAGNGKDHLTADDFRRAMIPPPSKGFTPGDAPSIPVLVRGLYAGEIGSIHEGPKVGDPAPDFALKTPDGKSAVRLADLTGSKPVVLVFGNFTCGPFRGFYPEVDAVYERFKGQANFLMVYVREAHPTDGWHMESNAKAGVSVKQPATAEERAKACDLFRAKLKPGMPVVVDGIDDPVGNAYSGMPARLYVIDAKGKVAYKSGRGPFGFKPGELEQALVMALLEAAPPAGR